MSVTKVSDITVQDVADYLGIAELTTEDSTYISTCLTVATDYICNYTGIDSDDLDSYIDMIAVVYVLCQDMYDTRSMYVDESNVNKLVTTILNMHSKNLLPSE